MQVDVTGLQQSTTYYVRTVSTGKETGSFTDTNTYYYPDFGSLLPVTTAAVDINLPTWSAGLMLAVYHPNGGKIHSRMSWSSWMWMHNISFRIIVMTL